MCRGVVKGLASLEFSLSPSKRGICVTKIVTRIVVISNGVVSFLEKYGWKFILSRSDLVPIGLEEPGWCKNRKCTMTNPNKIIGIRKCSAKNRVRVAWETENPPQSQVTNGFPRYGIAEKMLVITVAPQKDICPHGST